MTFQAYIDTIRAKTGKEPKDFLILARAKGLSGPDVKAGDVISWLVEDFGLGRGHAMAIYALIKDDAVPRPSAEDRISRIFGLVVPPPNPQPGRWFFRVVRRWPGWRVRAAGDCGE
jgi:Domain of unknown function (DUF4287)